jgi:ketosteroid isomerase-like protein
MASSDLTPVQARNLELARGGLESWISGDREAAIATFSDDVVVHVPAELGNAGTYRGIEQFRKWNQSWEEVWSEFTMSVVSIENAGEGHVVALINSQGTGTASGIDVENTLGWVLGINEDGLMDYLGLQPDLEAARKHAQEREAD